ncbi:unnamed protein product [Alternaria alternata]
MAMNCITWVFREQVGPKNRIPEEIFSTMQTVERTIKCDPSAALGELIKDLQQANIVRQRYQEIVRDLIGQRNYAKKVAFPPSPLTDDLAEDWRRIRSSLKNNVASNGAPPSAINLATTGLFSKTHLADLAIGRDSGTDGAESWISTQDREEIRRIDKMAFQLFTQQSCFKNEVLPDRVQKIRKSLEVCAKRLTTAVGRKSPFLRPDFMSAEAVKHALGLKRTLMLSVYEYEVHFASPQMDFDSVWMDAENYNGDRLDPLTCFRKQVSICVFPALVQVSMEKLPADADITTALLQAKNFFPPAQKASPSLENDTIVAKAVVLVFDADVDVT